MLLMFKDGVGSAPVTGADENVNSSTIHRLSGLWQGHWIPLFYFHIIEVATKEYSSSGLVIKQENDFHLE